MRGWRRPSNSINPSIKSIIIMRIFKGQKYNKRLLTDSELGERRLRRYQFRLKNKRVTSIINHKPKRKVVHHSKPEVFKTYMAKVLLLSRTINTKYGASSSVLTQASEASDYTPHNTSSAPSHGRNAASGGATVGQRRRPRHPFR